ncbi:MAG: acyl-phosphate glycerol 3-phosphate acyltransferase [Epulopiscium sp. Nele67-Bin005]|nr:MAG: acyl-phosphate glycerol 3-phosphate acyltransferase [Epulopiscium sp. Nele67-Bin005]
MYRVVSLLIGYLFGGIQTSIIYSKLVAGQDIREHGSKNAGSTNVLRVLGKKAGVTVFIGDLIKSIIAILVGQWVYVQFFAPEHGPSNWVVVGLYVAIGAILGHSYPVFFQFRGGKGIAVTIGCIYLIDVRIGLLSTLLFYICVKSTRMVSLSSMLLTSSIPFLIGLFYWSSDFIVEAFFLGTIITLITVFRHKANIARIIAGTEAKLGEKKPEEAKEDD